MSEAICERDDAVRVGGLSRRWKYVITILGVVLVLPGIVILLAYCLIMSAIGTSTYDEAEAVGIIFSWLFMMVTLGAGGVALWHGRAALRGKPSAPLQLPPIWVLVTGFGLLVMMGYVVTAAELAPILLFPLLFLPAAALPPLWAVAWFTRGAASGLTRRRGWVALAGGATAGVLVALVLELALPGLFFALVDNFAGPVVDELEHLFDALAGRDVAEALTGWGFVYAFVQLAVIAPLAEEFAKPLVTLPLVKHLPQRTTFLVGAMAGAGFAALENVLYATSGYGFWIGILLVRAVGGAIHPLGSGLMALAWRDVLCREPGAFRNWFKRFGLAAGMHALWNGGTLLVITLAGAQFFGTLPPEVDVLGLSAGGTTLALLIVLGIAALWLGRAIARAEEVTVEAAPDAQFVLSDRAVAIWALACLVALVPLGITGLRMILR